MAEFDESCDGSLATKDGMVRLMSAIIIQALIDSQSSDYATRIEASLWLASDECEAIGEAIGFEDVFKRFIQGIKLPERSIGVNGKLGWRIKDRKFARQKGFT